MYAHHLSGFNKIKIDSKSLYLYISVHEDSAKLMIFRYMIRVSSEKQNCGRFSEHVGFAANYFPRHNYNLTPSRYVVGTTDSVAGTTFVPWEPFIM